MKLRNMWLPVLLCAVCLGSGMTLVADEVKLKNGDRLTGTIVKSDGKALTLKTEFAGVVNIAWEAVEQVTSGQPLYLGLNDGQTVAGTITGSAGKYEVETKDAGNVAVTKSAIKTIRNQDEQTAFLNEVERLRNPSLLDLWAGSLDMGYALTRGNAGTNTFTLGANALRATTRDKISVYAAAIKADARNPRTNTTDPTANAIRGGGAYNKEYFSTGLRRSSGEVLIGEELTHKLSSRSLLKERLVFFPNLSNTGEYRLNLDTSLVTNLNRWLSWQVTLSDRYLSNPVPGAKKNDVLLTTGIRLTFAK